MTSQQDALSDIAAFLEAAGVPYMVIGGIANLVWGQPRATLDIDVTVLVASSRLEAFLERVAKHYRVLVADAANFVNTTRVLPVQHSSGVRIDLIFGLLSFEEEAIARAVTAGEAPVQFRVCTAEDLVLMKIISERPRDLDDAREILQRRRLLMDWAYLEPRVHELAMLLERHDIVQRWRAWTGREG